MTVAGAVNNSRTAHPTRLRPNGLPRTVRAGRGERIRTSGLYVPNVALYQAKLHPDFRHRRLGGTLYRPNTQF